MIWRVEHVAEVDSTNGWLVDQAKSGASEGNVIFADFQSAGRGRLDRQWVAPVRSALLCSFLFRPELDADQLALVMGAVALSARAALRDVKAKPCRVPHSIPGSRRDLTTIRRASFSG